MLLGDDSRCQDVCQTCVFKKDQHPLILCICRQSKQSERFQCDLAMPLWRFFIACNMQQALLGFNSGGGGVGWGGCEVEGCSDVSSWRKTTGQPTVWKQDFNADVTLFWFGENRVQSKHESDSCGEPRSEPWPIRQSDWLRRRTSRAAVIVEMPKTSAKTDLSPPAPGTFGL